MANDYGKFLAGSDDLKAHLFRYRSDVTEQDIEEAIQSLREHGFVQLYQDRDGVQRYGRFEPSKWIKHQTIKHHSKDELPDPGKHYPLIGANGLSQFSKQVNSREVRRSSAAPPEVLPTDRIGEDRNPPISPKDDPIGEAAQRLAGVLGQDDEYWIDALKFHHSGNQRIAPSTYLDAIIDYLHRVESGSLKRRPGGELKYILKSVRGFHSDLAESDKHRAARNEAFAPPPKTAYPDLGGAA